MFIEYCKSIQCVVNSKLFLIIQNRILKSLFFFFIKIGKYDSLKYDFFFFVRKDGYTGLIINFLFYHNRVNSSVLAETTLLQKTTSIKHKHDYTLL